MDKTDLIYKLVTEGTQYFLSRPRRFGKSLLTTTLRAYFEGRKTLFDGLAIEKLETEWKKYPVFHLDFAGTAGSYTGVVNRLRAWMKKMDRKYECDTSDSPDLSERFAALVDEVSSEHGPIVFLVDEYDKPLLATKGKERERIRNLYKSIFGNLKSMDECFRFAWLTGITKFAKVSIFSDLNQLDVISMNKAYATLCGITQAEMEETFGPEIDVLAAAKNLTREACLGKLREMYDGYRFCEEESIPGVYNPFSLLKAFREERFGNYWFGSGTPSLLISALQHNVDKLRELPAQDKLIVNSEALTSAYEDNDDPLTLLYQSGYLTIKAYDEKYDEFTLDYPNAEVRYGFLKALIPYVTQLADKDRTSLVVNEMSRNLEDGCTASFMEKLQGLLAKLPYHEGPDAALKSESVFRNVVASIFLLTGKFVHTEKHTSQGRIDSVVETPEHVYLFEFKVDKPVEEALGQIERNGYARPYAGDSRTLHKIGAVFSTKTRTLADWREVLGQ